MPTANIFDKNNPNGIHPQLAKLEQALGLPARFCEGLLREDDWSFVIKLHAVLEAALTTSLVEKIGLPGLKPVFSRMEMSQDATGKLAFAEGCELLDSEERRYVRRLSELRNQLVHRIQNVSFDLKAHIDATDKNQREAFVKAFGLWRAADDQRDFAVLRQYATDHPKSFIWEGGVLILALLTMGVEIDHYQRELDRRFQEAGKAKIAEQRSPLQRLFDEAQSTNQSPD